MRVLVYGGRDFNDIEGAWSLLDSIHADVNITCIIDGMARGADTVGYKWAIHNSVDTERFPADWARFGKVAGFKRNKQMLDEGRLDMAVEFPGGAGTRDMRARLDAADILVID